MSFIKPESLSDEALESIPGDRIAISFRNGKSQSRLFPKFLVLASQDPKRQTRSADSEAFLKDPLKITFPVQPFVPTKPLIQITLLGDQSPAAFLATAFENPPASRRLHFGSKSYGFGATAHVRLKGSFRHGRDYTTGGRNLRRKSTISV
jgi:hypothetical protein